MAGQISGAADQYNGFVVIHGTDTQAFTSCVLSLLLAGLDRPVVVTGALHPLGVKGRSGERRAGGCQYTAVAARTAREGSKQGL